MSEQQALEPAPWVDADLDTSEVVLAAALDAYVAIGADGRVVAWNPAAVATFGWSREQAYGHPIEELIVPERMRDAHRAGLARVAAGDPGRVLGQRLQLPALHRDGHEFPIELTLTATDGTTGPLFHAFAHDITVAYRASRFTAVEAAVSRGLADAESSTAAAARVVEALAVRMGWSVAELWLTDDARQVLRCAARHVAPDLRLGGFALDELDVGIGLPGRVCQEARPWWIPDLSADAASVRSRAASRIGLRVAIGVPISTSGSNLGALCVYGDRVEDPEDSLVGLLGGLAAQVGQYLERRRAEELTVELARTKDEFLAMVTHELRNPLAVITAIACLADEELDELSVEEHREHLRVIGRNALRLEVMAGDLLDLGRLESGHLAIRCEPTDLCHIIGEAVDAVGAGAADKDLTVTVRVPDRLPLHADPERLRQVADNLLSNAIKYTPQGGTITVTAAFQDAEQWIDWSVADTGIGVPLSERPRLFRRFYRASTALERRIPGTGLGLVITRTIIDRHHGAITVADRPGPGTTFAIRLPSKPHP